MEYSSGSFVLIDTLSNKDSKSNKNSSNSERSIKSDSKREGESEKNILIENPNEMRDSKVSLNNSDNEQNSKVSLNDSDNEQNSKVSLNDSDNEQNSKVSLNDSDNEQDSKVSLNDSDNEQDSKVSLDDSDNEQNSKVSLNDSDNEQDSKVSLNDSDNEQDSKVSLNNSDNEQDSKFCLNNSDKREETTMERRLPLDLSGLRTAAKNNNFDQISNMKYKQHSALCDRLMRGWQALQRSNLHTNNNNNNNNTITKGKKAPFLSLSLLLPPEPIIRLLDEIPSKDSMNYSSSFISKDSVNYSVPLLQRRTQWVANTSPETEYEKQKSDSLYRNYSAIINALSFNKTEEAPAQPETHMSRRSSKVFEFTRYRASENSLNAISAFSLKDCFEGGGQFMDPIKF